MSDTAPAPSSGSPMRIRARGRSFLALVLSPEAPLDLWLAGLDQQIARSAGLFSGKPIILDLSLLAEDTAGLPTLLTDIQSRGVRIIGIEGGNRDWPAVSTWDWPTSFDGGRPSGEVNLPDHAQTATPAPESASETLVVDQAIRSGQCIQHMCGDIVILGAVASGAEIIASGSIHVYGPLKGRAIAGVGGRPGARIFAQRMEAELLALDGYYAVTDDIAPELFGHPAQTVLEDDRIRVLPLLR